MAKINFIRRSHLAVIGFRATVPASRRRWSSCDVVDATNRKLAALLPELQQPHAVLAMQRTGTGAEVGRSSGGGTRRSRWGGKIWPVPFTQTSSLDHPSGFAIRH